MSEFLQKMKGKNLCGCILSPEDKRDFIKSFPEKLVSSSNGESFSMRKSIGPILNQEDTNACTGFASVYFVNCLMSRAVGQDINFKLNPYFCYYWARYYSHVNVKEDKGATLRGTLTGLKDKGVWSCNMMFTDQDIPKDFDIESSFKIKGYESLNALGTQVPEKIIYCLTQEKLPVIISMSICPNNIDYETGKITLKDYESVGYHAMCIIGYKTDSEGTWFETANSWGDRKFGDDGFAWIHSDVVSNFSLVPELWTPIKTYF